MYHDSSFWARPAEANAPGWPTETTTSFSTRSGTKLANNHARTAPQS
jgi:hypothetical protein